MGVIALDFDGVLSAYESWSKNGLVPGEPLRGALTGCRQLAKQHTLVVFTARDDLDVVKQWLDDYGFPPMEVTNCKPASADLFIDDRGYRFNGSWVSLLFELSSGLPKPWWK